MRINSDALAKIFRWKTISADLWAEVGRELHSLHAESLRGKQRRKSWISEGEGSEAEQVCIEGGSARRVLKKSLRSARLPEIPVPTNNVKDEATFFRAKIGESLLSEEISRKDSSINQSHSGDDDSFGRRAVGTRLSSPSMERSVSEGSGLNRRDHLTARVNSSEVRQTINEHLEGNMFYSFSSDSSLSKRHEPELPPTRSLSEKSFFPLSGYTSPDIVPLGATLADNTRIMSAGPKGKLARLIKMRSVKKIELGCLAVSNRTFIAEDGSEVDALKKILEDIENKFAEFPPRLLGPSQDMNQAGSSYSLNSQAGLVVDSGYEDGNMVTSSEYQDDDFDLQDLVVTSERQACEVNKGRRFPSSSHSPLVATNENPIPLMKESPLSIPTNVDAFMAHVAMKQYPFTMPANVDPDKANASMGDGLLSMASNVNPDKANASMGNGLLSMASNVDPDKANASMGNGLLSMASNVDPDKANASMGNGLLSMASNVNPDKANASMGNGLLSMASNVYPGEHQEAFKQGFLLVSEKGESEKTNKKTFQDLSSELLGSEHLSPANALAPYNRSMYAGESLLAKQSEVDPANTIDVREKDHFHRGNTNLKPVE